MTQKHQNRREAAIWTTVYLLMLIPLAFCSDDGAKAFGFTLILISIFATNVIILGGRTK